MPSDRDLAQQWLAGRIHATECGCPDGYDEDEMLRADALLADPGVDVGRILRPLEGTRRLVIWLPIDGEEERTNG